MATPAFSAAVESGRTDTLARRLAQAEAARDAVAAERDALKNAMAAERDALRDERQALLRDLRNRHQQALQATRDQLTTALRLSNAHADALVSDARKQRDAAERKLRAMTVSTSWRLTAPLRGVVLGLRRVTGRG
ncbi:hypothetical protein [Loktanella sp. M215]|uniref:hypothetical protein n=1 Tax=Loktanella sp. M215 TaxID=2675431 RepID=UPI001F23B857|nr:hypothetical protein [Loktanella sp. M215]MCF7702152.1 hypothetical protein [Loktanella sp. M215]